MLKIPFRTAENGGKKSIIVIIDRAMWHGRFHPDPSHPLNYGQKGKYRDEKLIGRINKETGFLEIVNINIIVWKDLWSFMFIHKCSAALFVIRTGEFPWGTFR